MPSVKIQTNLRLSAELRKRLYKSANKNKISFNAEIVRRIEDSFRRDILQNVIRQIEDVEDVLGFDIDSAKERIDRLRSELIELLKPITHNAWLAAEMALKQKSSDTPAPAPDSCSSPSPH